MIIDAWMQHPTIPLLSHEIFEPLRRWTGLQVPTEPVPVSTTLAAMDQGGVTHGVICAWHGPTGPLISNDEVAQAVAESGGRLSGLAAVDLRKPSSAVRELRHIDTSAYTAQRYPPELVRYLKADGRKKVMFGTNFPMISPQKALAGLDALGLDDETRALFLEGNARRVFRI